MKRNHLLVVGAVAVLVAVIAGAAIAATKALTPRQESQAIINDAAQQLGVQPSELSNALKQALENRVDAAVADGRLTKAEGAELKERINAGDFPLFGLGPGPGLGDRHGHGIFHAKLEAAAAYLGMSEAQLREELEGGKTLAQVARDHGKSVDGLVNALLARVEKKIEASGRLTEAEKQKMVAGIKERITDLVNGRFPPRFGPKFHHDDFRGDRPAIF